MNSPWFVETLTGHGRAVCAAVLLVSSFHCPGAQPAWKPAAGPLMTKWAADVKPSKVLAEYPRPQMVREEWQNLNGLWDFAAAAEKPANWPQKILVPFPVESSLSGVGKM